MTSSVLYLSGPITGVKNYKRIFMAARDALAAKGYQVINPAEMSEVLHTGATWADYMDISLELLRKADALVQLPGWEQSRGANRELGFALASDLIVISLAALLEGGDTDGLARDIQLFDADPQQGVCHPEEAAEGGGA